MSRYLIDRINGLANVEVVTDASISGLEGHGGLLEGVRWRIGATGKEVRRAINHLFLFIGAEPNTNWLSGSGVSLDTKGFVLTGDEAGAGRRTLETTRRGFRHRRCAGKICKARRRRGRRGRPSRGRAAHLLSR